MSAFIDLIKLSLRDGKMINVPCHYIRFVYFEHRQRKGLKVSAAPCHLKFYVKTDGTILTLKDFK